MYILGLNDSNSAAAIIKDGELIAAAREERFDRIKFSDSYPTKAVDYCLSTAGIGIKELDYIVFAWNPGHELEPQCSSAAVRDHKHFLHYIPNNLLRHIGGDKSNKRIASIDEKIEFNEGELSIRFVPHHHSHAAGAFFVSPYEKAAIMTIDGYGDDITHKFFIGEGNKLEPVGKTLFPHSMGHVYAAVTQFLGYRANSDEWKVMGLAAYGNQDYYDRFAKVIRFDKDVGELRVNLDLFSYYIWTPRRYTDVFINMFGPERYPNDEITDRHMNIAASFQKRIEDVVLDMCTYLAEKTDMDNLCFSGGVAMNSKMNGRILDESPFSKVWVQPSADDAGCSLGACFYYWNQVLGNDRSFIMEHDYWGPGFSDDEIKSVLDNSLVSYEYLENPESEAAKSIADNKVIGWFQGRMEHGQRALGNRSLLADPRDPKMKDKINGLIKHREWYRPFAPSVMEEYQGDYFEIDHHSPFMQMVYPVRKDKHDVIPAVVHNDGTGRLQTVTKVANKRYWKLIDEFRKITGVAVVLDTSFNDNDEPIVCSPKEAVRTFYGTGIHELYMGNYRIVKSK
ncbi:carbamoyl transferase [Candidatus Scalindua japonica]|uniref:Carbamoyl transferase n=1 Tax=Candidatus Scalindua japonica TaxID=1284222 RepID=A0A286U429_9BACT|nr:carbamoyltransferase C-terminal domain-containing protein [Candidatus Scalindua japonica]GAX62908.1 carbamoyl transferase [Candidatus Scalindua japonica]